MNRITQLAIETATSLVGIKETTENRGKEIDEIQRKMGYIGLPYCVIFILYCYQMSCEKLKIKNYLPDTASSQTLFDWAFKNNFVYTNPDLVKPGDIAIWRKYKLRQGHAGLIVSPIMMDNEKMFRTIEANTFNSDYGNQRDGNGIYKRIRYAKKIDFDVDGFYLRGFIDVEKIFNGEISEKEFIDRLINNGDMSIPGFAI